MPMNEFIIRTARFILLIYYVVTLTFRSCFFVDWDIYQDEFLAAMVFDYLTDLFFLVDFVCNKILLSRSSSAAVTPLQSNHKHISRYRKTFAVVQVVAGGETVVTKQRWTTIKEYTERIIEMSSMFPLEVVAYLASVPQFYNYRCLRLMRIVYYMHYWDQLAEILHSLNIVKSHAMQRVWFLFITMAVLGHIAACLFYLVGFQVLQAGESISWLTVDSLISVNLATHEITILQSINACYLRAMYFSIQTLDTVGFGDIVAKSLSETWFCILFFYVSAFLVYYTIANLITVVMNLDSTRAMTLVKKAKFAHYANYRKLPPELRARASSYYDYQYDTLKGVDEQKVLSELPPNIVQQVNQHVIRDLLLGVEELQHLNKGLLNALSESTESYVYSPEDAIIDIDSSVPGLHVIARGEVEVLSPSGDMLETLSTKCFFGNRALKASYTSRNLYRARSFAEVLFLRGSTYRHICEQFLDKDAIHSQADSQKVQGTGSDRHGSIKRTINTTFLKLTRGSNSSLKQKGPWHSVWRKNLVRFARRSLRPQSQFRLVWNSLVFFVLLFYLTSEAWLLSASLQTNFWWRMRQVIYVSWTLDLVMLVDAILIATCFGVVHDGVVLSGHLQILQHYREHNNIVATVIAIFPFDVILATTVDIQWLPAARLLKMIHMSRLSTYIFDFLQNLNRLFGIDISFEMGRFLSLYFFLFELCHWAGCIWILVADIATEVFHYPLNWIIRDQLKVGDGGLVDVDYGAMYAVVYSRAIYWASSVMSSVGFSDILETNQVETVTVIFVMFIGYLLFNTLLGAIAGLIGSFNREKREFNIKVDKMRSLMRYTKIPSHIEEKVLRYYEYIWSRFGGVDEQAILNTLPKSLRSDVIHFVLSPLVHKVPFFVGCSEPMERMLLSLFELRIMLDGDVLVLEGDIGKEMFIVERGSVQITSGDRSIVYATLSVGDYIGESCLLELSPRTASAFAVGYVDTYCITNDNFLKVAEKFPSEYQAIVTAIQEVIAEKKRRNTVAVIAKRQSMVLAASRALPRRLPPNPNRNANKVSNKFDNNNGQQKENDVDTVIPFSLDTNEKDDDNEEEVEEDYLSPLPTILNNGNSLIEDYPMSIKKPSAMIRLASFTSSNEEDGNDQNEDENSSSAHQPKLTIMILTNRTYALSRLISSFLCQITSTTFLPKWFHVHPEAKSKLVWDLIIFVILVYYLSMVPLRLAIHNVPNLLYILDYSCDVTIAIDSLLYANAFACYVGGNLLTHRHDIWLAYRGDRLLFDLLASIPYDLLLFCIDPTSRRAWFVHFIRAILRIPKLIKVVLISRYYKQVERVMGILKVNNIIFRFSELTISIIIFGHWCACGWMLLAEFKNYRSCQGIEDVPGELVCLFQGTWVEQQYITRKISANGGSEWTRYIRAINWAIPLLTAEIISDIYPFNQYESLFSFFTLFCGCAINGAIIGSVVALVSDASEEITQLYRRLEQLRDYLQVNAVPDTVSESPLGFLQYLLTEEGSLTFARDKIFSELPHALRVEIDSCLKIHPYLRRCPFFDFCSDDTLRGIGSRMEVLLYTKGDAVVRYGDLGHEMFFIQTGSVDVVSADGKTLYSTLEDGSFFGETALFFKSTRMATIMVRSPFCVVLRLSKEDLDYELKLADYNDDEVLAAFKSLQDMNKRRNEAVSCNLAMANDNKNKLFKLVKAAQEDEISGSRSRRSWLQRMREALHPESYFRVVWDSIGLLILLYYIFSIPFYIAFLYGDKITELTQYTVFEILFDVYWVLDIVLKSLIFSFTSDLVSRKLVADGELIWSRYYRSYFLVDIISTSPSEVLILLPNVNTLALFMVRAVHLLRVPQLPHYVNMMEDHLRRFTGLHMGRTASLVVKAMGVYVILNHWLACGYFIIHRYAEAGNPLTYVIADGLATYDAVTKRHTVCDSTVIHCYSRSIYFVLETMSSIGYGDIQPYTNSEVIWQQLVAISGAYIAAIIMGYMGSYQNDHDALSDHAFKMKMTQLSSYMSFRQLPKQLQDAIANQSTYIWHKNKSLQGEKNEMLELLPEPSQIEILRHLHRDLIKIVPLLRDTAETLQRRLASLLRPQIAMADGVVYRAGDVGQCLFFVHNGEVKVTLSEDKSTLDSFGLISLRMLLQKQLRHGSEIHRPGDHFGEFCLLSKAGLRADSATAVSVTELYYITHDDLYAAFRFITIELRLKFLSDLYTRVGDVHYVQCPLYRLAGDREHEVYQVMSLHRLACCVVDHIVDCMDDHDDEIESLDERESDNNSGKHQQQQNRHRQLMLLIREGSLLSKSKSNRLNGVADLDEGVSQSSRGSPLSSRVNSRRTFSAEHILLKKRAMSYESVSDPYESDSGANYPANNSPLPISITRGNNSPLITSSLHRKRSNSGRVVLAVLPERRKSNDLLKGSNERRRHTSIDQRQLPSEGGEATEMDSFSLSATGLRAELARKRRMSVPEELLLTQTVVASDTIEQRLEHFESEEDEYDDDGNFDD